MKSYVIFFEIIIRLEEKEFFRFRIVFFKKSTLVGSDFKDIFPVQIFLEIIHMVAVHAEKRALPDVVGVFHVRVFTSPFMRYSGTSCCEVSVVGTTESFAALRIFFWVTKTFSKILGS